MLNEFDVLKIVIERLESAGILYMLTGSVAANFYTTPRMTRDIDIVIEICKGDAERIFALFSRDFYLDMESIKRGFSGRGMFNMIHNEAVVKVDFVIRKETEYRKAEFNRRKKMELKGLNVCVVSPEDLILSKLAWANDTMSEMQIRDVKNIFSTVKDLDIGYIEKWAKELGVSEIYGRAKI